MLPGDGPSAATRGNHGGTTVSYPYQTPPPPDPYGGQRHAPPQPYPPQPAQGYGYPQQPPAGRPFAQPFVQPLAQPFAQQPVQVGQPNAYATASVVLGFVAVLFSCVYGGFLGLIGLGVGIAGVSRSAATGVGRNASIGGIALNLLAVLISIAVVVYLIVAS